MGLFSSLFGFDAKQVGVKHYREIVRPQFESFTLSGFKIPARVLQDRYVLGYLWGQCLGMVTKRHNCTVQQAWMASMVSLGGLSGLLGANREVLDLYRTSLQDKDADFCRGYDNAYKVHGVQLGLTNSGVPNFDDDPDVMRAKQMARSDAESVALAAKAGADVNTLAGGILWKQYFFDYVISNYS